MWGSPLARTRAFPLGLWQCQGGKHFAGMTLSQGVVNIISWLGVAGGILPPPPGSCSLESEPCTLQQMLQKLGGGSYSIRSHGALYRLPSILWVRTGSPLPSAHRVLFLTLRLFRASLVLYTRWTNSVSSPPLLLTPALAFGKCWQLVLDPISGKKTL